MNIVINLIVMIFGFLSTGVVLIYKLGGFFKSVNINFKNINEKLEKIDSNYEKLNTKIDTKIDKVEVELKESISKLDSKIDTKIDKVNNDIKELATSNSTIETKIENIESRLVKFDEKYMVYFANKLMDTLKENKKVENY